MFEIRRLVSIGVLITLAMSAVGTTCLAGGSDQADYEWSVLVYLQADNNLNEYIQTDLDELMVVGSTPEVNVLVLVDGLYEPAYLWRVVEGDLEETAYENNGIEINTGDPETLRGFVEFSDTNWPAERMMLFFWDHGSNIKGVGLDETTGVEGESDWLSHQEVIEALSGYKVDIIASDECIVGQIEVAYEYSLGLETEYLVASEGYIGWRGFTYDTILQRLNEEPTMSTESAAVILTEEFTEYFSEPPYMSESLTMQAVIKLADVPTLVDDYWTFTDLLLEDLDSYYNIIWAAQRSGILTWGERGNAGITDLTHFVEHIVDNVKDAEVVAAGEAVLEDLSEVIVDMGVTKQTDQLGYHGLGIFFPHSYGSFVTAFGPTVELYQIFLFAQEGWLDFLYTLYGVE